MGHFASSGGWSRRDFLGGAAAAGLGAALLPALRAQAAAPLRFVFATDIHLMRADALHCAEGLIACLAAIEALRPKPSFILCGGDLTHESPQLDLGGAEALLDRFRSIWHDHTGLPTHFTFGNHDLAGTQNPAVDQADPRFGKGLFRQRFGQGDDRRDFYRFDAGGWRFLVLDDVAPQPGGKYLGEFADSQLDFARAELAAPATVVAAPPTIVCGHIPSISALPMALALSKAVKDGARFEISHSLVASNGRDFIDALAGGNVQAVFAGHLHHMEQIEVDGIRFINSGAVCGNWWKGPQLGCPEGFVIADLQPDGRMQTTYQSYGWKARA